MILALMHINNKEGCGGTIYAPPHPFIIEWVFFYMKYFTKIIVLIIICSMIAGCSTAPIEISEVVSDYLTLCNIESSSLINIDYKGINKYTPSVSNVKFSEISKRIDEVLEYYFKRQPCSDHKIVSGDAVSLNIEITDSSDNQIYCDDNAVVIVGFGRFDSLIEELLIGMTPGEVLTVSADALSNDCFKTVKEGVLSAEIVSIYQYTEEEGTADFLTQQNYSSFSDFYDYLFEKKQAELRYEGFVKEKDTFFKAAFEKCTFSISEEDLKNCSLETVLKHKDIADSLDMPLDAYYTEFLNITDEDAFFVMCTKSASYEIKKYLVIGALAAQEEIYVSDEYFDTFCSENQIDTSNTKAMAAARCYCLENAVLKKYIHISFFS